MCSPGAGPRTPAPGPSHTLAVGQGQGVLHLAPSPERPPRTGTRSAVRGDSVRQPGKVRRQASLSWLNRAVATKLSAPQMTANTDRTRMSVRLCRLVRSKRGSPDVDQGQGHRAVLRRISAGWIRNRSIVATPKLTRPPPNLYQSRMIMALQCRRAGPSGYPGSSPSRTVAARAPAPPAKLSGSAPRPPF